MTIASHQPGTTLAKPPRKRRPAEISPEALVARMQAHGGVSARAVTQPRAALEEARDAGLLATETEHTSLRVPKGLLDAAKRETGLTSNTDLGLGGPILPRRDGSLHEGDGGGARHARARPHA